MKSLNRFCVLAAITTVLLTPPRTNAAIMYVGESQFDDCCLRDTPGIHVVRVSQKFTYGTIALRFKIESDPGITMTYVSETHPFANTVGNTQTGITVCLDECMQGSIVVTEISYMGYGTTSYGAIHVVPHPDAATLEWVNCGQEPQSMESYPLYVTSSAGGCPGCVEFGHRGDWESFPGAPQWFNCTPLPAAPSTWGHIKALYRD